MNYESFSTVKNKQSKRKRALPWVLLLMAVLFVVSPFGSVKARAEGKTVTRVKITGPRYFTVGETFPMATSKYSVTLTYSDDTTEKMKLTEVSPSRVYNGQRSRVYDGDTVLESTDSYLISIFGEKPASLPEGRNQVTSETAEFYYNGLKFSGKISNNGIDLPNFKCRVRLYKDSTFADKYGSYFLPQGYDLTYLNINLSKLGCRFRSWMDYEGYDVSIKEPIYSNLDLYADFWADDFVCYTFENGVMTLRGNVDLSQIRDFPQKDEVTRIVAAKGTKFPMSCRLMFYEFNQCTSIDLTEADTKSVVEMTDMFCNLPELTSLDVSKLNTSRVKYMTDMFCRCSSLTNLDVSHFDTQNVTNMKYMFYGCEALQNLDVSGFVTDKVTDFTSMFERCFVLTTLNVSKFDTSAANNMASMFSNCVGLTALDVSGFNTENVTDMKYIFSNCRSLESLDVSKFNTSQVTSMYQMFSGCESLKSLNVTGFDTGNVTTFRGMFESCGSLETLDVSKFDTSASKNFDYMFYGCKSLATIQVDDFDTSASMDLTYMFAGCESLKTLNVSNFNTDNVTSMTYMFCDCKALSALDLSSFNTENATGRCGYMFSGCDSLKTLKLGAGFGNVTISNVLENGKNGWARGSDEGERISGDQTNAEFTNTGVNTYYKRYLLSGTPYICDEYDNPATPCTGMNLKAVVYYEDCPEENFSYQWKRGDLPISGATKSGYTVTSDDVGYYISCVIRDKTGVYKGELTAVTANPAVVPSMVSFDNGVLTLGGSLSEYDVKYFSPKEDVTKIVASEGTVFPESCYYLFSGFNSCTSMDLTKADTSKVTDMRGMFGGCDKLKELDLSGFDTQKVTDMSEMFSGCSGITSLDLSSFDVSKVQDMSYMFSSCINLLTLDLSSFDMSNVIDAGSMFIYTVKLKSLKLGSGITQITDDYNLGNGDDLSGWACGAPYGESVSGTGYYAVINNNGTNTYYKRQFLRGDLYIVDKNNSIVYAPEIGMVLKARVLNSECPDKNFAFAWFRDGISISGATTASYTVAASDAGHIISCSACDKTKEYIGVLSAQTVYEVLAPEETAKPSATPGRPAETAIPAVKPTSTPTSKPTVTATPAVKPTATPTSKPAVTATPAAKPTATPVPTAVDTGKPAASETPTKVPTPTPTLDAISGATKHTAKPPATPMTSKLPPSKPNATPVASAVPTEKPGETETPTGVPTTAPSGEPGNIPTAGPSTVPTEVPSDEPVITPTAQPEETPAGELTGVEKFVVRCYKVAFERDPDEGGFNYWKSEIEEGRLDGSLAVYKFVFSPEYKAQNTSDRQFITDLYTMFMGREPDEGGYAFWLDQMQNGMSRANVFTGFANSKEFYELCKGYGITAGYFNNAYDLNKLNLVNLFVERLYKVCLSRLGDQGGQNYWAEGLINGKLTGLSCATNFIKSSEYEALNLSDEEYVKNLYLAFMGREYDRGGLDYWLGVLKSGKTRDYVFRGFAYSPEFKDICNSYGITLK